MLSRLLSSPDSVSAAYSANFHYSCNISVSCQQWERQRRYIVNCPRPTSACGRIRPMAGKHSGNPKPYGHVVRFLTTFDSSILTTDNTSSDVMDFVKPYTYHLRLTPAHLYPDNPSSLHPSTSASSNLSSSNSANPLSSDPSTTSNPLADPTSNSDASSSPRSQKRKTPQSSPYTSHMLTLLIVTLPPLAYIVSLPVFPLRLAFFLAGAAPVLGLHPWVRNVLVPTAILVGERAWNSPLPESVVGAIQRVRAYKRAIEWRFNQRWSNGRIKGETKIQNEDEEERGKLLVGKGRCAALKTIAQRVVDNDRLTDGCWQSEMREVELWENERYVGGCLPCHIRNIRLIATEQVLHHRASLRPCRQPLSRA